MLKGATLALFLLFTANLQATADPIMRVLPGGVHTYVWEKPQERPWDKIELRLVIPVGMVHEKGNESGATYALAQLIKRCNPIFEDHSRLVSESYAHILFDATVFGMSLSYRDIDRLPAIFELFAEWAWRWEPQVDLQGYIPWPTCCPEEKLALAAYAGRGSLGWPAAMPCQEILSGFYNQTYRSLPVAVVVVGDFDTKWVERLIADAFTTPPWGDLGPLPEACVTGKWPFQVEFEVDYAPFHSGDPVLDVTLFIPAGHVSLSPRRFIAREILERHLSAYLGRPLDIYAIGASASTFLNLDFDTRAGDLIPLLQAVETELTRLAVHGMTKEEIGQVRKSLEARLSLLDGIESNEDRLAKSCIEHFRGVGWLRTSDNIAAIRRAAATITGDEVGKLAASLRPLHSGRITIKATASPQQADALSQLKADLEEFFYQ